MDREIHLEVFFYRETSGREPVREWLRSLDRDAKKTIGEDIKTVQFGWPLGMPLVRSLGGGLWEVRSNFGEYHRPRYFCCCQGPNGSVAWVYQENTCNT